MELLYMVVGAIILYSGYYIGRKAKVDNQPFFPPVVTNAVKTIKLTKEPKETEDIEKQRANKFYS